MIEYKDIKEIRKVAEVFICDKCGKKYSWSNSTSDQMEIQEFHHISFTGGYGSIFGDCDDIKCDICQRCLYDFIINFCRINGEYEEGYIPGENK